MQVLTTITPNVKAREGKIIIEPLEDNFLSLLRGRST